MLWHNGLMRAAIVEPMSSLLLDLLRLDHEGVEAGVSLRTINEFVQASGLEWRDVYEIVIPARTLKHRRARREPLSRDESDKLARLVRVFDQAVAVLGDTVRARAWLGKPKDRFAGRTPLDLLRTEIGGRLVEEMLGQVDEGMFA